MPAKGAWDLAAVHEEDNVQHWHKSNRKLICCDDKVCTL